MSRRPGVGVGGRPWFRALVLATSTMGSVSCGSANGVDSAYDVDARDLDDAGSDALESADSSQVPEDTSPDASVDPTLHCEGDGTREICRLCTSGLTDCFERTYWACRDGVCRFYCTGCVDEGFVVCRAEPTDDGVCAP